MVQVGPARRVWPRYLAGLKAGGASKCFVYRLPSDFVPGRYRFGKAVDFGAAKDATKLMSCAEFTLQAG